MGWANWRDRVTKNIGTILPGGDNFIPSRVLDIIKGDRPVEDAFTAGYDYTKESIDALSGQEKNPAPSSWSEAHKADKKLGGQEGWVRSRHRLYKTPGEENLGKSSDYQTNLGNVQGYNQFRNRALSGGPTGIGQAERGLFKKQNLYGKDAARSGVQASMASNLANVGRGQSGGMLRNLTNRGAMNPVMQQQQQSMQRIGRLGSSDANRSLGQRGNLFNMGLNQFNQNRTQGDAYSRMLNAQRMKDFETQKKLYSAHIKGDRIEEVG